MATGVIQLDRRLDRHTARDALAAFEQALAESQGQGSIVLDLAQVEDFDSAGMGAVVQGLKQARAQGIDFGAADHGRAQDPEPQPPAGAVVADLRPRPPGAGATDASRAQMRWGK